MGDNHNDESNHGEFADTWRKTSYSGNTYLGAFKMIEYQFPPEAEIEHLETIAYYETKNRRGPLYWLNRL